MTTQTMARMIFFGTPCAFSYVALADLLHEHVSVAGVIIAMPDAAAPVTRLWPSPSRSLIPIADPYLERALPQLAWEYDLPAFAVSQPRHADVQALIAALGADLACVACWPWRIPPEQLQTPKHGFWNIHPSLLPEHRGPAPLFWSFQAGETAIGVTVHHMDADFDSGPVVRQQAIQLREGASGDDADTLCAQAGAALVADALAELAAGTLVLTPQPPGGAYEAWPGENDFGFDTTWPARRAFVFMRGTAEWNRPYRVDVGATTVLLDEALGYAPDAVAGPPLRISGDIAEIQCSPGTLRARVYR